MRARRAVIVAMMIAVVLALTGAKVPSEQEYRIWLAANTPANAALRDKVQSVDDSYDIVFVPGGLGSQLKIGTFTYGKDEITAARLVFADDGAAPAETLNQFNARVVTFTKKVDIYGEGLDQLMNANDGHAAVEFAYDWRDDIDKTADRLNQFLAQRGKKRFVIVAHSMGGLVTWHWKNKYKQGPRENLLALVVLGSPLQGFCEPVRMVVQGYSQPAGNTFEKWAAHLVFGNAHAAIPTFPSIFQLLPAYDAQHPCLKLKRSGSEFAQNHHDPATWLGREGGDYVLSSQLASDTGLAPAAYAERVRKAIKAGADFRLKFDPDPGNDHIYLFYSEKFALPAGFTVRPAGGNWLQIDQPWPEVSADGRVPSEVALNGGRYDVLNGAVAIKLESEHGDLLKDPVFIRFVNDNIRPLIARAKEIEVLQFAAGIPQLKTQMVSAGWVIETQLPGHIGRPIPALADAAHELALYNRDALASETSLADLNLATLAPADALVVAAKRLDQPGAEHVAAAVYESAVLLDDQKVDAAAFDRLANLKSGAGDSALAAKYYGVAIKRLPPVETDSSRKLRSELTHKQADVLEKLGGPGQAHARFREAVDLGNEGSKVRVDQLEKLHPDISNFSKFSNFKAAPRVGQ